MIPNGQMVYVPGAMDGCHGHNNQHNSTMCPSFDAIMNVHCLTNDAASPRTHQDTTPTAHTNPGPPYILSCSSPVSDLNHSSVSSIYYLTLSYGVRINERGK